MELRDYKAKREDEDKAERKALFDELLRKHTLSGTITKEQEESYTRLFDADAESTLRLLQSIPQSPSVEQEIESAKASPKTSARADLANLSWTEIDKAGRLSELYDADPELYAEKFRAHFGRDPQTKN